MERCDTHQGGRIRSLDGLRGVAVILVLVWHFVPCLLRNEAGSWVPLVRRALYLTGSGVDLFFVISGFLIAGILIDQKKSTNLLTVFFLRRACRILPLYFLLLGFFLVVQQVLSLPIEAREWLYSNPLPIWSYATFTQNIAMGLSGSFGAGFLAPTWSLAVEEQFYLLMPLLVLCLKSRTLFWFLLATLLALPLTRLATTGFHTYVNLPWRADSLLVGALLSVCMRSEFILKLLKDSKKRVGAFALMMASGIPLMVIWPGCFGVLGGSWIALSYGMIVYFACEAQGGIANRLLANRFLVKAGTYSYGLYMFHQAANGMLHGLIRNQAPRISTISDAGTTLLALLATLFAAWISFHVFESRIIRWGRRFQYQTT